MKKLGFLIALAALANPAIASDTNNTESPVKFGLYAGFTYGGDEVGKLYYEDDSTERVKAGGLYTAGASLSANVWENVDVHVNLGYHADSASASNGDMTFSRIALDAIPYYRFNEYAALGLGLTLHSNVKLDSDFTPDVEFESATGFVLSGKYFLEDTNSQFELRYVIQEYTLDKVGTIDVDSFYAENNKIDGNHFGLYYYYMF